MFLNVVDFNKEGPLTGEFLLGYHQQRQALYASKDNQENE
jgi:CRISPR-associated protein (Cas_Csd1).